MSTANWDEEGTPEPGTLGSLPASAAYLWRAVAFRHRIRVLRDLNRFDVETCSDKRKESDADLATKRRRG